MLGAAGRRADVDAAGEPAAHGDEAVVVAQQPAGIRQQHAHLGETARQHETFDDLEEAVLVVQVGLEIGRVDRHEALGAGGHGVHGRAHLFERADHADLVLLAVLPETSGKEPPGAELRCEKLLKSNSPVVMDDDYSRTLIPGRIVTCARASLGGTSLFQCQMRHAFIGDLRETDSENVCWFALYASHT